MQMRCRALGLESKKKEQAKSVQCKKVDELEEVGDGWTARGKGAEPCK